jgi:hypothetical protein
MTKAPLGYESFDGRFEGSIWVSLQGYLPPRPGTDRPAGHGR